MSEPHSFDVLVIGGGPGGYVAAIRCAQLGFDTACVDDRLNAAGKPSLGGTCLNVGCIPSKALLESSRYYAWLHHHATEHGILCDNLRFDLAVMQARKTKTVDILTRGIAGLFRHHNITTFSGSATLSMDKQVAVTAADGTVTQCYAHHIIIATGSRPATLSAAPCDDERITDSTGALGFTEVPARLGVIGAGVIGLELGSVWARLGSKVTLLEALPDFLPAVDHQIAEAALKEFRKQGLDIHLNARLDSTVVDDDSVRVSYEGKDGPQEAVFDKLVVAVGRVPNSEGLGVENTGLALDERGFIQTDAHCRTNLADIYAIGDVAGGPMLAHKASEEGVMVAEFLHGEAGQVDYHNLPGVIYTDPEIAWSGQTEQQLINAGIAYRAGSFPFAASGRARAHGNITGMVKILSDAHNDRVLGVHVFGTNASELVAEGVLAMAFESSSEDIARTIHAHPTLAEAMKEAALAVDGRALHA